MIIQNFRNCYWKINKFWIKVDTFRKFPPPNIMSYKNGWDNFKQTPVEWFRKLSFLIGMILLSAVCVQFWCRSPQIRLKQHDCIPFLVQASFGMFIIGSFFWFFWVFRCVEYLYRMAWKTWVVWFYLCLHPLKKHQLICMPDLSRNSRVKHTLQPHIRNFMHRKFVFRTSSHHVS